MNSVIENFSRARGGALSEILLSHLQALDSHFWPGGDGMTLDVVLACYTRAAAAGHVPGKAALIQQHPELAAELEGFFNVAQPSAGKTPGEHLSCIMTGGLRAD